MKRHFVHLLVHFPYLMFHVFKFVEQWIVFNNRHVFMAIISTLCETSINDRKMYKHFEHPNYHHTSSIAQYNYSNSFPSLHLEKKKMSRFDYAYPIIINYDERQTWAKWLLLENLPHFSLLILHLKWFTFNFLYHYDWRLKAFYPLL